jgi:hypothetical protein
MLCIIARFILCFGVTRGGKYIIYLEQAVNTALLSDDVPTDDEVADIFADLPKYYKRIVGTLNVGTPADFNPNLDTLDAIIQSVRFN